MNHKPAKRSPLRRLWCFLFHKKRRVEYRFGTKYVCNRCGNHFYRDYLDT